MAVEIIGRHEELVAVGDFLDAVPAGGQALLLEGDAGIGKTALWQEANRLARERGSRVLTARAAPSEAQIAFATIGDLFAPVVEETVPQLMPVQRRALETALLMREPEGPPPGVRLLGLALLSVVRALAQDGRPLLVGLDDVQWIDRSSAEVLRFMLRRLEGEPVGVLATVRGCPVEVPLQLDRAFEGFRRLTVESLSVGAIRRLLWHRLELSLPRPKLLRVHEIAGGNPFFALELGRAIIRGATRADSPDVALPESLNALVTERLEALPARVRDTLVAVAALAAPSVPVLEPLAAAVVDHIALAEKRGVVELDGDRIRFTHPLLAPACYAAMPLHRRRRLHRRLAELNVDLEERARHLAIAATRPDEGIAAALDGAAAHARARGAVQAAAELSERAVELTPRDAVERIDRRRITAAENCRYAGDVAKAEALLEEVVDSSPPGPVRAEALGLLAGTRGVREGFPVTVSLLSRALAEPDLAPGQEVDFLCELAWRAQGGGDTRQGARYAEAALALAEDLGDRATLAHALAAAAQSAFVRTGTVRHDLLDRALALEQACDGDGHAGAGWSTWHAGLPMRLSIPARSTLALLLGRSNRHDESRALWIALTDEARERADPDVVTYLFHRAQMEMLSGAWDTAAQLCDEAIQLAREVGQDMLASVCLALLAEIDAYRGETEQARRAIPELLRVTETARLRWAAFRLRIALAVLELSHDDPQASWRQVAPLFDDVEEPDVYLAHVAGSAAIEALIATGDLRRAERLLAQIDRRAAHANAALRPLVLRCRGLLLAARGDQERAIASFEAAALAPEPPQGVDPFELARTLLALGTVQRQARHHRAARDALQRAAEIFDGLGARVWSEKTHAALARIGGRAPSSGDLTPSEQRIADLVAEGKTNKEVAAILVVSDRTVESALTQIYRKLDIRSRTELAHKLAARA